MFFILAPKYEMSPPSDSSASDPIPPKLPLFLIGDLFLIGEDGYY
jgi:hypothetical protein